ncbi:HAUS augmin-like complex subunit 6 [Sigmodon hispidus]
MSSAWDSAFEKKHLWMYLQALGLDPSAGVILGWKTVSHAHLGENMFDKLNRDAFYIVSYFLFQTLDESLAKEVFRYSSPLDFDCWPPLDQRHDMEFRKHCCEWLKEISAECGSSFPQVFGSLFLSPGGPKFIHLMYHFARYVAIKYIKTKSNDTLRFAETFNTKQQDMHKSIARCHVARNRFLQILQREHYVIQKYQENAHLSTKQVRNLRSEYMVLQNQIKRMDPCCDQSNIEEKIQKVRSLWTSVNETLMFLEKEREIVSSVFSLVNQCTLDGTNVAVNIPRLLLDRIEEQICQSQMGNVYEAGKLNLLTIIQLLNEVLKVMKYEHCKTGQARLTIDLQYLEKETRFQSERLSDMKHMRHKIKENVTAIRQSILEKEEKWHKKWKGFLGLSPFSLIKGGVSAVDLLPPMSPLSFDPVPEEVYAKSVLLKFPASLPDTHKEHNQENGNGREADTLGGVCALASSPAPFPLECASSSDANRITLLEKDPNTRTPKEKNTMTYKKEPDCDMKDSLVSDIVENTQNNVCGEPLPRKKSDPFQKEQDHLAEEVVRAVLSDSPQLSEGKEIKLEELMNILISDPFLPKKQIPRTPENLITEIRSSWRKAVETEDNRSSDLVLVDAKAKEVSPESSPVLNSQRDLSLAIFSSDFDQSYLTEEKAVPDQLKNVPQIPLVISQIGEPPTEDKSDLISKKVLCKQDLECANTRLSETGQVDAFSLAVGSGVDVMGKSVEDSGILDHSQASCCEPFTHRTLLWNSFQRLSGIGILHETLPEEAGRLSLNSSVNSETNFRLEPNSYMHSDASPDDDAGKREATPEIDSSFQAILSSFEALKKSLKKIREESHLSSPKTLEQHTEWSPAAKDKQADDTHTTLSMQDLFIDYTKPSPHMSLDERTQSVSPLTKVSLAEQKLRTELPCSLSEFQPSLKGKS